jgi:hypothetical protein
MAGLREAAEAAKVSDGAERPAGRAWPIKGAPDPCAYPGGDDDYGGVGAIPLR